MGLPLTILGVPLAVVVNFLFCFFCAHNSYKYKGTENPLVLRSWSANQAVFSKDILRNGFAEVKYKILVTGSLLPESWGC